MKQISEAFAARLAADDTTLCACWRFARTDGAVFGATDHDAELVLDGVSYLPSDGIGSVTFESSSGLAPGRATASGFLRIILIRDACVFRVFRCLLAGAVALVHVTCGADIGAGRFFACEFIHYELSPCSCEVPTARSL